MKFTEEISYDVPIGDELKEKFAASAEVSSNGKVIRLGNYKAEKKLRNIFSTCWKVVVDKESSSELVGTTIEFTSLSQERIIDFMATLGAIEQVSDEQKKDAFKQALRDKLATLEAN